MRGEEREDAVTESFVALATSLALGADVVDLVTRLTADCARLLDVGSAGLLLGDERGALHVMAASSQRARDLEVLQVQRREGPCRDCWTSGRPVHVPDLREEAGRWPVFAAAAAETGVVSVHALPMRLRTWTLGALGLFGTRPGPLEPADLRLGQALADVASVALVQDDAKADPATVTVHLQAALNARVLVEQAKGVVAHAAGTTVEDASARLSAHAGATGARLSDVAREVVHLRLPVGALPPAPARGQERAGG
ncbi:GAF and ANTAR domain-containing protein [Kineococcus sp. SYSU DK004]|uniref:GAF and ANTAR domain-containing protein n=1 Tax=Kineococcus sp. SYSU DK004 TaxID=3383125 RepID=UPI003D7DA8EB